MTQKGRYRAMHLKMSQITKQEVLARKRWRYARAGKEHKSQILDESVELFDHHRKAAIRALRAPACQYDPDRGSNPPLRQPLIRSSWEVTAILTP